MARRSEKKEYKNKSAGYVMPSLTRDEKLIKLQIKLNINDIPEDKFLEYADGKEFVRLIAFVEDATLGDKASIITLDEQYYDYIDKKDSGSGVSI